MKFTRFWIIAAAVLALLAAACAGAETAPVEYRVSPGAGGSSFASVTGGAGAENLVIPAQTDGVPVREIGRAAFAGNTVLKTLTVEEGVRSIGVGAFEGCSALEEVVLPASLTFIEKDAFRDCASLSRITLPGIMEAGQVREGAFAGVALEGLKLAGGADLADPLLQEETLRLVTRMDGWLFRPLADGTLMVAGGDGDPARLEIPGRIGGQQVTAIGEDAFRGRASLREAVLPEGLKTVGSRAFADCLSLSQVTFPASLECVEPLAFSRTALASPVLPPAAAEKSSRVWYASEDRTDPEGGWTWNLLADGTAMISGYPGAAKAITVPNEIGGLPVTALMQHESRYLAGAGAVESVRLPAGLKVIGERAFSRFTGLAELNFPKELEEIGDDAFYNCAKVDHLKFPGTLKHIGKEAFNHCRRLGAAILPDGLEEIPVRAFEGCSRLADVRLPRTLRVIGERAFAQTNITALKLPESLEIIRKGAFMEHRVRELVIPAGVKHISAEAFYSFNPACPKKVRFLNPDTELETGIFGYSLRDPEDNINNPLNWIDVYREESPADWKDQIQITCYPDSTADRMYAWRVKKDYLRNRN